jgi:hypothetical protein
VAVAYHSIPNTHTLKKLIDDFIKQNDTILGFLDTTGRHYEHADKAIPLFAEVLSQTKFNVAFGVDFANVLQLSHDKNIFEQYDLNDISKLFASLLRVQAFNLDTYIDASNFEWAIMDNRDKAKSIANEGIQKAKEKIQELERLLETINND